MAQDTYLEMVTALIVETGLNGGQPPIDVATATGDAAKACYWIQVADLQLQRERIDFDFLWYNPTVKLVAGNTTVRQARHRAIEGDNNSRTWLINAIAKDRLAIINSNGEAYFPTFMEWEEFSILYNYETQQATDFPSYWSMKPDRTIKLSQPIESEDMTCKYECWRKPLKLRQNTDVSRVPDDFGRLIILLAKILYAEHEDAPEVDAGSSVNYELMFNQMLSVHAPQAEWQRMENSDQYLQVETR